jgi:uncharacterized circularly permuted ATP-grasp superfamily protein
MRGNVGGNGSPAVRDLYARIAKWLEATPSEFLARRRTEAEFVFRRTGITFAVYLDGNDTDRLIPFDIIPRLIDADEWDLLQRGLAQRVRALNAFLADAYGPRDFIRAGQIPEALVIRNPAFLPYMNAFVVPGGPYTHVAGIDVVRTGTQAFHVLEDNCRTPSGAAYMLENREVMMRLFPDLFRAHRVRPVSHYPEELLRTLQSVAPPNCPGDPVVVLLTPGQYNSAYYEHSFLADEMGIELVEGADLVVRDGVVHMRTTTGLRRVDVIYRRIDDAYLDPLAFRPDSALGVPGLMAAYRAGNVTIANAPGAGVADDKAVYCYVPNMIRFFLGENPLLPNVPTWQCAIADDCAYVLEHLDDLVVKDVQGSGGYGMLVGPHSTAETRAEFADRIRALPDRYVAQPTLALSTCPAFVEEGVAPRHVDLRPYVLCGGSGDPGTTDVRIVPGGLTRVALRSGSLVVNSSQGGGTKDTWVIEREL